MNYVNYVLPSEHKTEIFETDELFNFIDNNKTLYSCLRCYYPQDNGYVEDRDLFCDLTFYWDVEDLNDAVRWHVLFNCSGYCTHFVLEF
jgi:hypothetical protein